MTLLQTAANRLNKGLAASGVAFHQRNLGKPPINKAGIMPPMRSNAEAVPVSVIYSQQTRVLEDCF